MGIMYNKIIIIMLVIYFLWYIVSLHSCNLHTITHTIKGGYMTLDSYKNFVAIVESGSILSAANKLLIAQPSLSNQLKNIEKNYGAQLLIRGSRSLELTEAGQIFYRKAKEICRLEGSLREDIVNSKTGFSDMLKISIPAGNSTYFLHKFFDPFMEEHPRVSYNLCEVPSEYVIPNVLNNTTEIGMTRCCTPNYAPLSVYPCDREDIVAVFPKEHPLADIKGRLQISQVQEYNLAIPSDCLDIVRTAFAQHMLAPNVAIITSPKTTAIEWARSFGCVALVSLTDDDKELTQDMTVKKFDDPYMYVTSAFIVNKEYRLSDIAVEFLKLHGVALKNR